MLHRILRRLPLTSTVLLTATMLPPPSLRLRARLQTARCLSLQAQRSNLLPPVYRHALSRRVHSFSIRSDVPQVITFLNSL